MFKTFTRWGALALAMTLAAPAAFAQEDYPTRPVTIIVPFAAGGGTDVIARTVAQHLQEQMGQPFVVENRPGAGGTIGIGAVARAEPDGYTLLVTSNAVVTAPGLYEPQPFDPVAELTAITELGTTPDLVTVRADSPFESLDDVMAAAKADPGGVTFGSGAQGASPHLMVERLQNAADIELLHIPVPGASRALQGALSGTTQLNTGSYSSIKGQIDAGEMRALFHAGPERLDSMPDVPTLSELGYDGFVSETFMAMLAPAGTDPAIVQKLADAVTGILQDEEVRAGIEETGLAVTGTGPEALNRRVAEETPMWAETIEDAGVQIQ